MTMPSSLGAISDALWQVSDRTKRMLNPVALISLFSAGSEGASENHSSSKSFTSDETEPGGPGPESDDSREYGLRQKIGLVAGPALFAILLMLPVSEAFTADMRAALACTAWVAVWWVSESIPIPATSLLPLVLFPLMGVLPFDETAVGYANSNVFLFLGGFMLAVAMQKWNLHRRIALAIINKVGTNPSRLILGFMIATAGLSMWISNTATTMMMMPIGVAVIIQLGSLAKEQGIDVDTRPTKFSFGTALMLGIAYSATVGGVATLIGTPPNAIFASVASSVLEQEISFAQWMLYGFPISVIFTYISWAYLVRVFPINKLEGLRGGREVIRDELEELGDMKKAEKLVLVVFSVVALTWVFRSLFLQNFFPGLSDPLIAILGALVLFLVPVNFSKGEFLLDWDSALNIPWGVLLLFGGGISIAAGFTETGLASWVGNQLAVLEHTSMFIVMLAIVGLVIALSNVTSNTGTVSMMLPVMVAMAMAMNVHPYALMITATTAGSFAFMLPVGTPPNAVVFGSKYITIPQMAKAGLFLTVVSLIILPIITYFWVPISWGVNLHVPPVW